MISSKKSVLQVAVLSSALKILLIPSAFSTDFEVHRHWKALTLHRPLSEWYLDTSSPWTLDYPPLFAYFERLLAQIAAVYHPDMVDINNRDYSDPQCILFMRASVIITDIVFALAVMRFIAITSQHSNRSFGSHTHSRSVNTPTRSKQTGVELDPAIVAAGLLCFNSGLILVDGMHFQYNGLVIAFLMMSLALFMEGKLCQGAAVFSLAINLKHTLLPVVPAIALYLLLCVRKVGLVSASQAVILFGKIALSTITTFSIVWMPLYFAGGRTSIVACLTRMFPIDRGLLHAYWAPNFWCIYASADKFARILGCQLRNPDVDIASGHIGAFKPFVCLPNVAPMQAALLVLVGISPALFCLGAVGIQSLCLPDLGPMSMEILLPQAVAFSSLSAFVFGWHVHEKMILLTTAPLCCAVLFSDSAHGERILLSSLLLSAAGNYGLFPLLTGSGESLFKNIHFAAFCALLWIAMYVARSKSTRKTNSHSEDISVHSYSSLCCWNWQQMIFGVYCVGFFVIELYAGAGGLHVALFGHDRLQFFPLALVSLYCSIGVLTAYLMMTCSFLRLAHSSLKG